MQNFFETLKLSLNKQKEILTIVKEISLREDIPILKVIKTDRVQKILSNEDLDRNQKIRKIRIYLKQRRFPVITAAEKEFENQLKNLSSEVEQNLFLRIISKIAPIS